MSGRRPKPMAMKLAAGNPGRRPLRTEPQFGTTEPTPPDYLAAMPDAMRAWNIAADELRRAGNFRQVFHATIEGFCISYALLVQAHAKLQAEGIIADDGGKNPAVGIANAAARELRAFAGELGFTPAAVSRVAVLPENPQDSLADFVRSRHR